MDRDILFEKLEQIDEAVSSLSIAKDDLDGCDEADEAVDAIEQAMILLASAKERISERIAAIDAREVAALEREYWRSVI